MLLFLIPFTAFWSGLSMWGIYGSQIREGKFDLHRTLLGLPFLLGSVVLLCFIAFLLFGAWRITLAGGQGRVFAGVGALGWTRRFLYNRDTLVSLRMTSVRVNEVPQQGIQIRNPSGELVFGTMLTEEAKRFIAATIQRTVRGGY